MIRQIRQAIIDTIAIAVIALVCGLVCGGAMFVIYGIVAFFTESNNLVQAIGAVVLVMILVTMIWRAVF